jgi:glycosyltransferase involved in cell wall biosynthesis
MTKVVHVVHWPKTGITRLLESIFFDIGNRAEFHMFFLDAAENQVDEFRGLAKSITVAGRGGNLVARLAKFVSALRAAKPDVIHTHSFTPSLLVSIFFPKVHHVRTVHSAYPYFSGASFRDRLKRFIEFSFLDRSRVSIVFVADGVKNALAHQFSRARLTTIQNGVNCANIQRLAGVDVDAPRPPDKKLVLCSVGRLEHQKGYDLLVSACQLLPGKVKDNIHIKIAGVGSQQEPLQRQIEGAGLAGVITLLGYQENPYPLIAGADICVFSSRYEGFSVAAAEAMALGCPVITTRVTGVPELLTNGVDAIITDAISPQSLCDAMLALINNEDLRVGIGARGKLLAEQRIDIATTAEKYLALYGGGAWELSGGLNNARA